MKFKKLNTLLTLTANIGVLIGLFLVAYELRQNDDSLNATIQLSISSSYEELATFSVEHPSMRDALVALFSNPDQISTEEMMVIMAWQYRYQMVLFTTYNLYTDGIVSEAFWREKVSHYTVYMLQSELMEEIHYSAMHDELFSVEFYDSLDSIFEEQRANRIGVTQ